MNNEPDRVGTIGLCHGPQLINQTLSDRAEILIPTEAGLNVPIGEHQHLLRPPYDFLFLPAETILKWPVTCEGWRLQISTIELCTTAVELSRFNISHSRFAKRLLTQRVVQPRLSPECEQVLMLHQQLKLGHSLALRHEQYLQQIGVDKLILRIVAVLLCGDLLRNTRHILSIKQDRKAQIMEELILWIRSNLHLQLQLSDLAERSGYSERSLRNYFHERFQSGPIQWIRRQRLELARDMLISADATTTVTEVASSVGYSHLSQFSRDFQQLFSVRPSDLAREARRCD